MSPSIPSSQPYQPDATVKFTVQGSVLTSSFVAPTLRSNAKGSAA